MWGTSYSLMPESMYSASRMMAEMETIAAMREEKAERLEVEELVEEVGLEAGERAVEESEADVEGPCSTR